MNATDIRNGIVIIFNNDLCKVMEFRHHTPGNLRAVHRFPAMCTGLALLALARPLRAAPGKAPQRGCRVGGPAQKRTRLPASP